MMQRRLALLFMLLLMVTGVNAQETTEEYPPMWVDVTGTIESVDPTTQTIVIDGVTVVVDFASLPEGLVLEVGVTITISGELLEDGTIVADLVLPPSEDEATPENEETPSEGEETETCGFQPEEGEAVAATTEGEEESEGGCHPVIEILSEAFEVPYSDLEALRDENFGIGEIARAYLLADVAGVDVQEIIDMRESGMGWGEIKKEYPDVHPSQLAPGSVIGNGRGNTVREDENALPSIEDNTGAAGNYGNGQGNSNGNGGGQGGNGNANGNGNGNGNGNANGQGGGNGNANGNGNGGGKGGK